jgi:hypothetical protein
LGPLSTAVTNRPIVPSPADYDDGEIGGMIGRGTEVLGENLPQCRFVHHKSHMLPGREPLELRHGWLPTAAARVRVTKLFANKNIFI